MHSCVNFLRPVGHSVRSRCFSVLDGRSFTSMPSATQNKSVDDVYSFKYESIDGLPVSPYKQPDGFTMDAILRNCEHIDPFASIKADQDTFSASVTRNVASHDKKMTEISRYLLDAQGKRFRPAIIFLLSCALNKDKMYHSSPFPKNLDTPQNDTLNNSPLQSGVRAYLNTEEVHDITLSKCGFSRNAVLDNIDVSSVYQRQKRLGEIVEIIHVASLYHDDVIDNSLLRRGQPSANGMFGSRNAVLSGLYQQARASIMLGRLQNHAVTGLVATIMDNLVKGEVQQMKDGRIGRHQTLHQNLDLYITKTYYKTASLIANACHGAAVQGEHGAELEQIARRYGQFIGISFQVIDDILDFTASSESLGKPAMNDQKEGISTAPVLFAADEFPEMYDLMERKFKQPGDVERAVQQIHRAKGLEKSKILAEKCAECAASAALQLPPSTAREGLLALLSKVLTRQK